MRRALLAFVLGCLFTAAPAHTQHYPGVALRWNHCFGEGTGLFNRTFACDTNVGFEELIGSFAIGEDMLNVSGNEIVIDVFTGATLPIPPTSGPLPEWWMFRNPGTCRRAALGILFAADPGDVVCQDWGAGVQVGALGAYIIDFRGPGTARIKAGVAVPPDAVQALHPGNEYYSFTLRIRHDKTVGTGACAGCSAAIYLTFNSLKVTTHTGVNDWLLNYPLNGSDANFASWNLAPVPTRTRSWGAVKALYR